MWSENLFGEVCFSRPPLQGFAGLPMTMRAFFSWTRTAGLSGAVLALSVTGGWARSSVDPSQVAVSVASWLERGHYTRQKLDDEMSRKFLQTYLTTLDYNKLYFTQKDVAEFEKKYGTTLAGSVLRGDLAPSREIFARFKERVTERVASNKKIAQKKHTFDSKRTVEVNRQDSPWPVDTAEADRIWRDRIEAELLKEQMAEIKLRPPAETIIRRYDQVLRNVNEMEDEDILKTFLTALAMTYDPHSEYLSPSDLENFQIQMKLSLVGVGAVLSSEDGYAKVKEVVAGGPADRDGRLAVNDRIAAVAQGEGEFEDVVDMKLDKVVEKIRGKKGSTVKLLVIPANATDPSKREVIDIRRDEVKLKESEAKAEVLDLKDTENRMTRIGWITLPSFYANMDGKGTPKSTTADVAALLGRLKAEGIQGLVIDLRRDGGGSLEEAINLTGLFIPKGPVVQSKDSNGKITVSQDLNSGIAYSGPLVVLVNRLSASASEIFAAALQDYGRAVIVGDERTFGKGTVQTVIDVGRLMSPFSLGSADAGALKLTIQKFYRVKGGSTQLNGVSSDIVLPSLSDTDEIGEGALKNRLAYDEVAPVKIIDSMAATPLFLDELRSRSTERIGKDPEFQYIVADRNLLRERIEKNSLSLNEAERRRELAEEKERKEVRAKERKERGPALAAQAYELKLDDLNAPKLRPVAFDRKAEKSLALDEEAENEEKKSDPEPDPIRNEALRIMRDLIELNRQTRTASIQGESPANP
jgi:carboxyl-terminal processing protease